MVEQVARHQDGTPSGGVRRGDILDRHPTRSLGFVLQQANQCVQMGSQLIFASEMGDHASLDFLALAHRLDQTQVLMPTIGCLDRAKEHAGLLRHYIYRSTTSIFNRNASTLERL